MNDKVKKAVQEWIHAGKLYNNLYKLNGITIHDTQCIYCIYDKNKSKYFIGVA